MISCGIVAEYNPFHNGHKYQIDQVRSQLNADVVIAVMSGNFLQRGEPALVDKWTRTKMALAGGVDLVVELPAIFAVQPADFFAKGAITLFRHLGVDALSFGVEKGTAEEFLAGAKWMIENDALLAKEIKSADASVPYAQQMEEIIQRFAPDFPLHLNSPNNQLAFAYSKEIVKQGLEEKIKLFPLIRQQAGYNERELKEENTIASATAIRLALQKKQDVSAYLPEASGKFLKEARQQMVSWEEYFPLLKYQLTVQTEIELQKIYQMSEGLENRLKASIKENFQFGEFLTEIKTKRYTQVRLQRLLTYALLQWEEDAIQIALNEEPPIRVLGFSKKGQKYLSKIKRELAVPMLVNVNQGTKDLLPFDLAAGEIYRLGKNDLIVEQDFKQKPVKIN